MQRRVIFRIILGVGSTLLTVAGVEILAAIGLHSPKEVCRAYRESLLRLAAMTAKGGALLVPVLQPVLVLPGAEPLTDFEQAAAKLNESKAPGFNRYYTECYQLFQQMFTELAQESSGLVTVDASQIFSGASGVMFVDICHLTTDARRLSAHRIGEALLAHLPGNKGNTGKRG